jgi:fatty-acid desaturase
MREDISTTPQKYEIDFAILSWMIIAHGLAFWGLFHFSWGALAVGFGFYVLTAMVGITLGFHRLLTHRAFKAPKWVERTLATCGVFALQGSPKEWVAHHRMHHAGVETDRDPHNARRGFWYSHMTWMFLINPEVDGDSLQRRYARDIIKDPYLNWLGTWYAQIGIQVAAGLLLLLFGGLDYMLWGIFVRLVWSYHVTWFVNSAAHKWGYRSFETDDLSTNCWWVGLLAFGEGWHNNHHAFPDIARASRRWWEIDVTWYVIWLMEKCGLAYAVRRPPQGFVYDKPKLGIGATPSLQESAALSRHDSWD